MPKQRQSEGLLEFVKLTRVGDRVLGRMTKHDVNDNGSFITLEPVLVKHAGKDAERFGGVALGLTADLRSKVTARDENKWLLIGLVGFKASGKGDPTKLFAVYECEADEDMRATIANDELFRPVAATSDAAPFGVEQDELPF